MLFPTANPLARLWIIKHSILAVDLMFDLEIVRIRNIPSPISGHSQDLRRRNIKAKRWVRFLSGAALM
jgi:hypothetical protein